MRIDVTDYHSGPQAEREIVIALAHFKNQYWLVENNHVIKSHPSKVFLDGVLEGMTPKADCTYSIIDSWKYTRPDRFEGRY